MIKLSISKFEGLPFEFLYYNTIGTDCFANPKIRGFRTVLTGQRFEKKQKNAIMTHSDHFIEIFFMVF